MTPEEVDARIATLTAEMELTEAQKQQLNVQRTALLDQIRALNAKTDQQAGEIGALRTLAGASEAQQQALAQMIAASGIPSQARMGRPGR